MAPCSRSPVPDEPPAFGTVDELWSLREDVSLEPAADALLLRSRWGTVSVSSPSEVLREALRRMELGPGRLENVPGTGVLAERVRLLVDLQRLGGLVVRSVGAEDGRSPLLSVVGTTRDACLRPAAVSPDRALRLSRFSALRSVGTQTVLESPLAPFRAVFNRPEAGWLIASFGTPLTGPEAVARLPLSERAGHALLSYLVATGMLQAARHDGEEPRFAEDDDPVLRAWTHHDLMFHWSSRPGLRDTDFGRRAQPVRHQRPLRPAGVPPAGQKVVLPRSAGSCGASAMSLAEALRRRASVRTHGSRPMTTAQLGELLYHALAVRPRPGGAAVNPRWPAADRGYPSGGNSYELEAYLSVGRCEGLAPGVYYYAPAEHCLVRLPASAAQLDSLLSHARAGAGMPAPPDVLLTLTAGFGRVSSQYHGMAYALTLKNVGVVQQTLYLLATAMGIAGCAIGTGDGDAAARAFGLDWRQEPAVGEFVLGSLPESPETASEGEGFEE